MKKQFAILLSVVVLSITPAIADQFQDDFDLFSEMYGVQTLKFLEEDEQGKSYMSGLTLITYSEKFITIIGSNALDVIAVGCCCLQCMDNTMNHFIDQRGRVLHAYINFRARGETAHSVTEDGIKIIFYSENDYFIMGLGR